MTPLLWANHGLMVLFALSSGLFKAAGGEADLRIFAHLGLGPGAVAAFGLLQAAAGVGLVFGRTLQPAAITLAACNAVATAGLFAAGVQPFGVISVAFVAMALLELRLDRAGRVARPPRLAPA